MDKEFVCWHTLRGYRYPDAFWQWFKVSQEIIKSAATDDKSLETVFNYIHTTGSEYDNKEIDFDTFVLRLKTASVLIEEADYYDPTFSRTE